VTPEEARRTLKVSPNASMDDIRTAYKRLARTYHPDNVRTGDANTFVLIAAAYFVLRSNDVGIDTDDQRDDYEYVLDLRQQLKSYFDDALTDFSERMRDVEARARRYVTDSVSGDRLSTIFAA
jgi:DnaJ-class molecular chaperone